MFIFPAIGSIITHAILLLYFLKQFSSCLISLYLRLIVSFSNPLGIPGELGLPNVDNPEPASDNKESE